MRVLHVISGLRTGGAENMLLRLVSHPFDGGFEHRVLALRDGPMRQRFVDAGIDVLLAPQVGGMRSVGSLIRMREKLLSWEPDVIQGWMYHGNLAASVLAGLRYRSRVIWGIRQSLAEMRREKSSVARVIWLSALLSWLPAGIVYNSNAGRRQHEDYGFRSTKSVVIRNGIDSASIRTDRDAANPFRRAEGVAGSFVVGMAARRDPMKAHDVLIRAAGMCMRSLPGLVIMLAGADLEEDPGIRAAIEDSGLSGRVHFVGEIRDMSAFYTRLDVFCLSSWAEGFPNVLVEAMAHGMPCVATRVGDCDSILGDSRFCVPAGDVGALAERIIELGRMSPEDRAQLGREARERVVREFDINDVADRYGLLYRRVAGQPVGGR